MRMWEISNNFTFRITLSSPEAQEGWTENSSVLACCQVPNPILIEFLFNIFNHMYVMFNPIKTSVMVIYVIYLFITNIDSDGESASNKRKSGSMVF